jgi:hypothetical protein
MSEQTQNPQEEQAKVHRISFVYDEATGKIASEVSGNGKVLVEMLIQVFDEEPMKTLLGHVATFKMAEMMDKMKDEFGDEPDNEAANALLDLLKGEDQNEVPQVHTTKMGIA